VALGILIGGLALLLFPAVQAAREQARRTQCHNSLKNISLSLRHYHEVCNTFPMDVSLGDGLSAADATDPDGTVLVALSRQADDQAGVASAPRSGSRPEPVSFEQRSIELIHVPAPVTGVAVSPDGKLLAVTSGFHRNMGELTVWNLADRTRRFETKRPFGIRSVTFSPDGKLIATGDFEQPAIQRTAPGARSLP
jgi:WD40 repeat protein